MMIWKNLDNNKTILAGATIYKNQNTYDNVLMEITNHSYKTIYKQRVPVPISMWKYWIEQGANAYFFNNPIIEYKKSRVGVFICYEQLLSYTYFHTMLYNPDYIIGISNLWWVEDKSIVKIQKRSLKLWGILFKKDVYYSANR
jgi:predicted amidohydrolase